MSQRGQTPKNGQGIFGCTVVVLFLLMWLPACRPGEPVQKLDVLTDVESIRQLLMDQQADWNAGDVESYMEGYIRSDSLRFASGGTFRFGWKETLERYYSQYPDRASMGTLAFSDLDIDVLSPEWAMTFGSWHLTRGGEYSDIGGLFTLILHRNADGWKIMYDHTSQAG